MKGDLSTDRKVEDIQVLRAVAILLVFFQHLSVTPFLFRQLFPGYNMPFWLGVELFFVISGFVVTASVLKWPPQPISFLIRRFFRLIPAILCFLAFSAVVCILAWLLPVDDWGKEVITGNLSTFVTDALGILTGTLTIMGQSSRLNHGAMWSLSVEFQFYLAYAALMIVFLKAGANSFRHAILVLAVGLYAVCLVGRVAGAYFGMELPRLLKYIVFFKFDFLLLGVIGAAGVSPLISRMTLAYGPAMSALLLLAALALAAGTDSIGFEYVFIPNLDGVVVPIVGLLFLGTVLLASLDRAIPGQGTATYRSFVFIGELSYSIYLVHLPVFALFWIAVDMIWSGYYHWRDPGLLQMIVCAAATVSMAWLIYSRVETPMNRLGHQLAARLSSRRSHGDAGNTARTVV